jgi:GntR family transcriptional regulator, vanillate catabolism transcriptional regulator
VATAGGAAKNRTRGGSGGASNLDDRVYERIKSMIVAGTLLPGERVVPEQFAREMGVSRTPMLSALKRLTQESMLEWRSRRGVFVRRLSARELALIFEIREVVEGLAARRAAQRIKPSEVRQLRALFAGIDAAETPQNRRRYLLQDWEFHMRLLNMADSEPLTQTVQSVNIMVLAFGGGVIRPIVDGMSEHEAIFDALTRGDADAAEAAMRLHIARSVTWLHGQADMVESTAPPGALYKEGPVRRRTGRKPQAMNVRR